MNGLKWHGALLATSALCAGACFAQEAPEVLENQSYIACMTPAMADRGTPEYPSAQLFAKTGGLVRVALTFTGRDTAPHVRILNTNQFNETAFEDFSRSVERFVAKYRLPCWTAGAVGIQQNFQFEPDAKRVVSLEASDAQSEMVKSECRFEYTGPKPVYPSGSQSPYGNVYLRMKFMQRDEPPQITVVYGGGHYLLAETTKSIAEQYRLRCAKPIEAPVETTYRHRYTPYGGQQVALKDMEFVPFLRSVVRSSLGKPKFDFQTMSCPFEVKVTLLQPHAPNVVRELERSDPRRKEFLEWMASLVFNYPEGYERVLIGESATIAVPCMNLDLS